MPRNIYLASSWRNQHYPEVLAALRTEKHEVYDFRNPPGRTGFSWKQMDEESDKWSPEQYVKLLQSSPIAAAGFESDMNNLQAADTCVLVLPCGRSAHLELGWATGAGKDTFVLVYPDQFEPDLMYLMNNNITTKLEQLLEWLAK